MAYRLVVSAAGSYDQELKQPVSVNSDQPTVIETDLATISLLVRIQHYRGPESDESPESSNYFSHTNHLKDLYSIAFAVEFKEDYSFDDVLFGNDFDQPIRDSLPYGSSLAMKIFRYAVDPSADGDIYADKPYLYGYAVTSVNTISLDPDAFGDPEMLEDTHSAHSANDDATSIPESSSDRSIYFQSESNRKSFTFKANTKYCFDFFNAYLDLSNGFAVKLPGYTMHVMQFWDGQPLRYVLKSKSSGKLFFALYFDAQKIS
ncbi:uncharacterized protein V1516DRAFT_671032 [Lipomyces oligophaga]|uniref:uncharacterized protein n=1 Tax=Lipomyces oligophaga TaxID=45792 RepID=UPI0034CEAD82